MKASEFLALPALLARFSGHFPAGAPVWEWLKGTGPALAGLEGNTAGRALPPGVHVEGAV